MKEKATAPTPEIVITSDNILSLYSSILTLIYSNPEHLDMGAEINKQLTAIVPYDFYVYAVDDSVPSPLTYNIGVLHDLTTSGQVNTIPNITAKKIKSKTLDSAFLEILEEFQNGAIQKTRLRYPNKPRTYHIHQIISMDPPRAGIVLYRFKEKDIDTSFTKAERAALETLAPHVLQLYRIAARLAEQSDTYKYFDTIGVICKRIANEHGLSDTEYKFLPEILFGYSNEKIAKRNFISVATVKKHIQHILQKTNAKNKVDFVGKFFTSPKRVEMDDFLAPFL